MKSSKKKYVITSAQSCASPHSKFLSGLESYSRENNSELIVLPMIGQSAAEDFNQIHKVFSQKYNMEFGKKKLNNNIQIEQFNVRPYQIDPVTGLARFAQRATTLIFASPKQRLKPIPHSNKISPKFLVTTGACTRPNYATGQDVSAERRRLGDIARRDHIYGALVVEIEDNVYFHIRHLRADTHGKFVDFGKKYDGKEIGESKLEAMVLGDYHLGQTDPMVRDATFKMIEDLKPRNLILHDFFDGHSVSHHSDKKFIEEKIIQVMDKGHHVLEDEFGACYKELKSLSEMAENIYVIPSNHHDFLNRWLNEGRFMKDPRNARSGFKLAGYMATKDYNDPVEAGIKMMGDLPENIKFLNRDEDLKIRGYQLGAHGDRGPGGRGGSIMSKENDYGKSITGHVHKAQILRNTYTVGTMTPLQLFYTRGSPTDWSNTHGLLWDNATVQLINIFNGRYKTK